MNLGSIVFLFNSNAELDRDLITIAVTDGTTTVDCQGGAAVYNEGVVNCIMADVSKITLTNVRSTSQIRFREIFAFE